MCQRGFHHSSYYSSGPSEPGEARRGETCTECGAVNETLRAELAAVEERQRARFAEMTGGHPDDMPF